MTEMRDLGIVYITGGASGLGAAVVEAVAAAGGKPAVLDRVEPQSGVPHAVTDVADSAAVASSVEELVRTVGPPDAVVTAAGTDSCGPLATVPAEDWERVIRVNLIGTAAVVRACLPHLERSRGTVVTIGSTLGLKAAGTPLPTARRSSASSASRARSRPSVAIRWVSHC